MKSIFNVLLSVLAIIPLFAKSKAGFVPRKAESCEAKLTEPAQWSRMEVIPGIGWDNLRNMDMGLVFEYDYSLCQLTNDRKFLLPDGFFAIPVQESDVELFSEIISHWEDHTSLTAFSINAEASFSFSKIGGKFSSDYTKVKTTMQNSGTNSIVARVQIRHNLYVIRLQPGTKLNSMFKTRLLDIAAHIINNNSQIAHYLSELLVRDYGTHYTTAAHAGAILVQEDYIKGSFASTYVDNKQIIRTSASASFFGKIGLGASYTHVNDDSVRNTYLENLSDSHVRTIGGPPFRANFTINDWEDGLADTLVTTDREGVPLHFAIIPEVLTELPPAQTLELAHYVEKAISSYYKHNTHYGCTNPDAENFYFGANIDDGSCKAPTDNFTFGGVYQICSANAENDVVCPSLVQMNPLTGDYSCPLGYRAVLLSSGSKSGSYITQDCAEKCKHFLFVKHGCHQDCHNVNNYVTGVYQTYWCVATGLVPEKSGYLFGGLYSSVAVNPITKVKSCPNHFYPLRFGEDTHICVSDDYELAYASSVPFAGFESCIAGNPLATKSSSGVLRMTFGLLEENPSSWPHRCPTGYAQHLASVEQSCEINYCVKAGALDESGLPPIRLPPYRKYPSMSPNTYNVLTIVSAKGNVWAKDNKTDEWKMLTVVAYENLTPGAMDLQPAYFNITNGSQVAGGHSYYHDNNSPATAAIIISSTALLGLVIVVSIYGMYRYKGRKTRRHSELNISYENIDKLKSAASYDSQLQLESTADV